MRVLLDENLDRRLKGSFASDFEVLTVVECGWAGTKNGDLLRLAEAEFDAFVTMDSSIEFQQNLRSLDIGIVLIRAHSNRRTDVEPLIPAVNDLLHTLRAGEIVYVPAETL